MFNKPMGCRDLMVAWWQAFNEQLMTHDKGFLDLIAIGQVMVVCLHPEIHSIKQFLSFGQVMEAGLSPVISKS